MSPHFSLAFDPFLFILAGNEGMHKIELSSNFGQIGPLTAELAAFERLKNFPKTYNGKMVSLC